MYESYLKISKWNAKFGVMCLAQKQIPKSKALRLGFQILNDGDDSLPSFHWVCRKLGMRNFD